MDVAVERGRQFCERMRDETADVDAVADVRGKGLMLAVDFDSKERPGRRPGSGVRVRPLPAGLWPPHHQSSPTRLTRRPAEMDLGMDLLLDAIDAAS